MSEIKRNIPQEVKRILRQESCFGCCICGHPILEYHHLINFADLPHHNPGDMMVLCPNHHHQATVEAISVEAQRNYKATPYNKTNGFVKGMLHIEQRSIGVALGNNEMIGPNFFVLVDGEHLLQVRSVENQILLDLRVFDENENLLFQIEGNEWITGDPEPWDFEYGYRWIKIRKKRGKVILDLNARTEPMAILGGLWKKKQHFQLSKKGLLFNGVVTNSGLSNLCLVGSCLEVNTVENRFSLIPNPEVGNFAIVSWADPKERYARGLDTLAMLMLKRSRH